MKKKMLSVLLTALMVVSMSAGCGKDSVWFIRFFQAFITV